ncbi:class IIb bacteriocin, lactobin A/cerein 7B family [Sporosalibacterium faouarense]|uniref:class IIb bacteriocin, lactobin A/cerein 7B family n=1 Tax=Sporosalibacterium faouarense TaxID=516123 RepID=UPI00141C12ED|nr:class IIb bacteriocin, lactobin A/cerein 7B family [Sporosalibacterium faouarense]MTI49761.1 class IIb bacteriocin, lactobin A/cerein 7B family [Bacillota bacterium]
MSQVVGLAFEELEEQEMINVSGGAAPTPVTVTSSLWCIGASIAVSVIVTIVTD